MSVLPVRLFTDKVLHKSCFPVTEFTQLDNIVESMISTMFEYHGVGLAAPQVGLPLQLFVANIENKSHIIVVASPTNICYNKEKGIDIQSEGCLSCPGISVPIKRYLEVEFEYFKLNGEKDKMKLEGYDARIFQHEADHIFGRMITDSIQKL